MTYELLPRLTVEEYLQLAASGALDECPHVELLDGDIIIKKAKTPLHDSSVDLLVELFSGVLNRDWYVRPQKLIITEHSCPEPDVAVIRGRPLDYQLRHPRAAECVVAVEIATDNVQQDRHKAAIDAHAGIPEYWLVNLVDWQLERMTQPLPNGRYQQTDLLTANDAVPLIIGDSQVERIALEELLTPPKRSFTAAWIPTRRQACRRWAAPVISAGRDRRFVKSSALDHRRRRTVPRFVTAVPQSPTGRR